MVSSFFSLKPPFFTKSAKVRFRPTGSGAEAKFEAMEASLTCLAFHFLVVSPSTLLVHR